MQGQVVRLHSNPDNYWKYASATAVEDTDDVALKAAVTGKCSYLCAIQVYNKDASVGTVVVVKDGSTVVWAGYVAAAGGHTEVNFDTPIKGTAATALNFACITTSAEVIVSAQGYNA
jgi:hypothetical protein